MGRLEKKGTIVPNLLSFGYLVVSPFQRSSPLVIVVYPIISALRFVLVKAALMERGAVYCAFWINRAIIAATCERWEFAAGTTRPSA